MRIVYVDNNATTQVAQEVYDAMVPYFREKYGNPSSMHSFGGKIRKEIDKARQEVASLLGAESPSEIIFTSCGTESDNTAIIGILRAYPDKRHIITTKVEHPAVYNLCQYLEKDGYRVTYLNVDSNGMIDLEELRKSISKDTVLISIMHANNETGVIFPIEEIGKIALEHGVLFHTDAVQSVGKIPIDLRKLEGISLLSLSGHKLHAPKGIGALYVRRGTHFQPFIIGGHQENNRRGGTENVPYIIGLGKACELARESLVEENTKVRRLRDRLEEGIISTIPNTRVNGDRTKRLPNTTNISFEFVEGEAILLMLDSKGICASSGSACTSGSLSPSHVLRSMGVPYTYIQGSIRFSLSRYNTEEDVDYILKELPPIIDRLRVISPFGPNKKF